MNSNFSRLPDSVAFRPFVYTLAEKTVGVLDDLNYRVKVNDISDFYSQLEEFIELAIVRLGGSISSDMSFDEKADLLASLAHAFARNHNLCLRDAIDSPASQWNMARELWDRVNQSRTFDDVDQDFLEAVSEYIEMAGLAVVDFFLWEDTKRDVWQPSEEEQRAMDECRQQCVHPSPIERP